MKKLLLGLFLIAPLSFSVEKTKENQKAFCEQLEKELEENHNKAIVCAKICTGSFCFLYGSTLFMIGKTIYGIAFNKAIYTESLKIAGKIALLSSLPTIISVICMGHYIIKRDDLQKKLLKMDEFNKKYGKWYV